MSKKFESPITKERVQSVQFAVTSDIQKRYGEGNAKAAIAERAKYYSNEYLFNRPIGMAQNYRVSDLQNELKEYVEKKINEEQPKGFLFGGEIILFWVISAVIAWVVRKILDRLMDSYAEGGS